jgi:hypothetical protein
MSEIISPPHAFTDSDLPTVFLVGHTRQTELAGTLLRSNYAMNIALPTRVESGRLDTMTRIEDATWSLAYMRSALGGTGVLAVNLEPSDSRAVSSAEQTTLFGIDRALSGDGRFRAGRNIVIRVAPHHHGHEDYIGYLAGEVGATIVREEAEFIAQILSRLATSTRPIPS